LFSECREGNPIQKDFHSFFRHYHLTFDPHNGRLDFRNDVNPIFARNGIAYELTEDGALKS
jgi:hypothetical protein